MSSQTISFSEATETAKSPVLKKENDEGQLLLDILETGEKIIIVAPVAGIDEKTVEISLTEDLLTIRGERPRPTTLPKNGAYFTEECYWGSFSRNILLPSAVNSAEIVARLERDIIIIEVPKARKVNSKVISLLSKNE